MQAGVADVLHAYKEAVARFPVPRINELLDKLAFVYPYRQAIGFYL